MIGLESHSKKWTSYLPFEEARDIVRKLKLKNMEEWYQYSKSGKLPDDIPQNPRKTYKNKGCDSKKGYGYWLGTNFIAHQKKKFRSFGDARDFVHILRLESQPGWYRCKSGGIFESHCIFCLVLFLEKSRAFVLCDHDLLQSVEGVSANQ